MTVPVLTERERETLLRVLAPFAERIESIGLFGSRATGRARPDSDIDLVIYGDLDAKSERRLWTMFDETDLSVSVDPVAYSRIKNSLLREHIDSVGVQLFTQEDLKRERNLRAHQ